MSLKTELERRRDEEAAGFRETIESICQLSGRTREDALFAMLTGEIDFWNALKEDAEDDLCGAIFDSRNWLDSVRSINNILWDIELHKRLERERREMDRIIKKEEAKKRYKKAKGAKREV